MKTLSLIAQPKFIDCFLSFWATMPFCRSHLLNVAMLVPTNYILKVFSLTVLKHKNTVIFFCRYLGNMLNSHSCFSCFTSYCMFRVKIFLFSSVWLRPLPIYTIVFQLPRLPVDGKTQRIAAMEASKRTGSEIADSTPPNLASIYKALWPEEY